MIGSRRERRRRVMAYGIWPRGRYGSDTGAGEAEEGEDRKATCFGEDSRHPQGEDPDGDIVVERLEDVAGEKGPVDGGILVLLERGEVLLADVQHIEAES